MVLSKGTFVIVIEKELLFVMVLAIGFGETVGVAGSVSPRMLTRIEALQANMRISKHEPFRHFRSVTEKTIQNCEPTRP